MLENVSVMEIDSIVIESVILAAIIFGAIYVEQWNQRRMQKNENDLTRKKILLLIKEDMIRKM